MRFSSKGNVLTPAGAGATAVATFVCQAAEFHSGMTPPGWLAAEIASLSVSGGMSRRRNRQMLARSDAWLSGSLAMSK